METNKKSKDIGHAVRLTTDLNGGLNMVNTPIDLNMLNILVGANGTGKTLILKVVWLMNMITQLIINKAPDLESGAQFILDNTIPENKSFGYIRMEYESGAGVELSMLNGGVVGVGHSNIKEGMTMGAPIFLSAAMRLFSSMKWYLRARKDLETSKPEFIATLCKDFKLYDILYIERLIHKMPFKIDHNMIPMLSMSEKTADIKLVEVGDDDFIITDSKGAKYPASHLSNGEQSILNMALGSGL